MSDFVVAITAAMKVSMTLGWRGVPAPEPIHSHVNVICPTLFNQSTCQSACLSINPPVSLSVSLSSVISHQTCQHGYMVSLSVSRPSRSGDFERSGDLRGIK